jgi:hypothetical protein
MNRQTPPSPNGDNGRDGRGRFVVGCHGGPGNPLARRVAELRAAVLDAVSAADLRAIAVKLVELARAGDLVAARLLFDRVLGPPVEWDVIERIEKLEKESTP